MLGLILYSYLFFETPLFIHCGYLRAYFFVGIEGIIVDLISTCGEFTWWKTCSSSVDSSDDGVKRKFKISNN